MLSIVFLRALGGMPAGQTRCPARVVSALLINIDTTMPCTEVLSNSYCISVLAYCPNPKVNVAPTPVHVEPVSAGASPKPKEKPRLASLAAPGLGF